MQHFCACHCDHWTDSLLAANHALHQYAQACHEPNNVCAEGMIILLLIDGRLVYAQLENLLFSDELFHVADGAQET